MNKVLVVCDLRSIFVQTVRPWAEADQRGINALKRISAKPSTYQALRRQVGCTKLEAMSCIHRHTFILDLISETDCIHASTSSLSSQSSSNSEGEFTILSMAAWALRTRLGEGFN